MSEYYDYSEHDDLEDMDFDGLAPFDNEGLIANFMGEGWTIIEYGTFREAKQDLRGVKHQLGCYFPQIIETKNEK